MKKILALILAMTMICALAACGAKTETPENGEKKEPQKVTESVSNNKEEVGNAAQDTAETDNNDNAPADKTETDTDADVKEEAQKPASTTKTPGNLLLDDFKAKVGSATSAYALAESLAGNSAIPYMMGAVEVEPGLLSGFDNAQITGFKEGAAFMPMIGSQPLIGYVFFLEDGVSASSFISNLKANANLRWNICVSADEMVTGNVGNKVFFVMSPSSFDAE